MSLNESIVEDAALEWFGELGYAVGHGAAFAGLRRAKPPLAPGEYAKGTLIPAFSQGEREKRESIRRLNPAIPQSRTLATLRDTQLPKLLSGELSVAALDESVSLV